MGGREKTIIRAAAERGEPIPESIANRPELWSISQPFWNAFWLLNRSRPIVSTGIGATMGKISYADAASYAKDHEQALTMEDLDTFVYLICEMDDKFLELNAPKKPATNRRR